MKQVYIAWVNFQRRPESMRSAYDYALFYVPPPFKPRWLRPIGYLVQAWRTMRIVLREKADVAWIQMPPNFLPHILLALRALTGRPRRIIADCHNSALRPPWSDFPALVPLLNRLDGVIAHNSEVANHVAAFGVDKRKLIVFETRPAQVVRPETLEARREPTVLVPCSFNSDEPVDALVDAAALAPDIRFFVTGNLAKAQARGLVQRASPNVVFTGFLSKADYEELLFSCTAVLGLTMLEGVQLSVANEAVGAGKAMVLSDTAILRDLFGSAALFATNEPAAIAEMCRAAIGQAADLDARSAALREVRERRWTEQAMKVSELVGLGA